MSSDVARLLAGALLLSALSACGGSGSERQIDTELLDTELVESIDIGGARMVPAYSRSIERYSLIPDGTTTALSISVTTADPTADILIGGSVVASAELATLTMPADGQTLALEVQQGVQQQLIELVPVPVDYPRFEVTTRLGDTASGDLYLSAVGEPSFSIRVDDYGVPSYVYQAPLRTGTFMRHSNGYSSFADRFVNEFGLETHDRVILDENLQEIARLQTAPPLQHTDSHDFLIRENGNTVFLAYEPTVRDSTPYADSVIQEVDSQTGEEVFRWNSWGVIPLDDVLHNNRVEYAHINSVFVDTDGHFLASLRGTSQIVKINRDTGEVIWKLGGVSNEFTIDDPLGGPCGQHHVTRLANGHILFFDNGIFCPPDYPAREQISRAVEYRLNEQDKTATLVWSYQQSGVYARTGGSAQRLPNGNTLIGWGGNTTGPSATEVNAAGDVVYEFKLWRGDTVRGSNRVLRY